MKAGAIGCRADPVVVARKRRRLCLEPAPLLSLFVVVVVVARKGRRFCLEPAPLLSLFVVVVVVARKGRGLCLEPAPLLSLFVACLTSCRAGRLATSRSGDVLQRPSVEGACGSLRTNFLLKSHRRSAAAFFSFGHAPHS